MPSFQVKMKFCSHDIPQEKTKHDKLSEVFTCSFRSCVRYFVTWLITEFPKCFIEAALGLKGWWVDTWTEHALTAAFRSLCCLHCNGTLSCHVSCLRPGP